MRKNRNMFMEGYDNVYGDSPYDQGYLDALCMLSQFNWSDEQKADLAKAKETLVDILSEE